MHITAWTACLIKLPPMCMPTYIEKRETSGMQTTGTEGPVKADQHMTWMKNGKLWSDTTFKPNSY